MTVNRPHSTNVDNLLSHKNFQEPRCLALRLLNYLRYGEIPAPCPGKTIPEGGENSDEKILRNTDGIGHSDDLRHGDIRPSPREGSGASACCPCCSGCSSCCGIWGEKGHGRA